MSVVSRRFLIGFFCFLVLLLPSFAGAAICQVDYLGQIALPEPVDVAFDDRGRAYVAQDSGVVSLVDEKGNVISTIGGEDKKWRAILRTPSSVEYHDQKVYVTDTGLDRIAIFSPEGELIEAYGKRGGAPGEFSNPADIHFYQGVLYVADTGNDRIQVLGANGMFLGEIGNQGEDRLKRVDDPLKVDVDGQGRIYVVDKTGTIKIYHQNGEYLRTVAACTDVSALSLTEVGVLVADSKKFAIRLFSYDFNEVAAFGSGGDGRGQFKSIAAVGRDAAGKVYVADAKRGLLQVFLPGKEMNGGNPFVLPAPPPTSAVWTKIAPTEAGREYVDLLIKDRHTIYAVDEASGQICIIQDGRQTGVVLLHDVEAEAAALDSQGALYVLAEGKVMKLTAAAGEVDYAFGPSDSPYSLMAKSGDLAISGNGLVYIADRNTKKIHVMNTDGIFIRDMESCAPGVTISDPVAIAVDATDRLFLLDNGAGLLSVFSPEGAIIDHFAVGGTSSSLVDMAVADGKVYLLDSKAGCVKLLSDKGEPLAQFGCAGQAAGRLDDPSAIVLTDDVDLLVADTGNQRLQSFAVIYTPAPPEKVYAVAGARSVSLSWARSDDALVTAYGVYRATSAGDAPELLTTTEENRFVDNTVQPGVDYFYRIAAQARNGNASVLSSAVSATAEKISVPAPEQVAVSPTDFTVTLSWAPCPSEHLAEYVILRNGQEVARTPETSYIDQGLAPETDYEYKVAAESVDGVLSESQAVNTRTLVTTRPPVEFENIELADIFSNTYKSYEQDGIGQVTIRNNTKNNISKLKVLFTIKNFMDFASESVITDLAPGQSQDLTLKAVFNDYILNVTEDTPVQTEIAASYYIAGELRSFTVKKSINVYEKHKMRWDDRERIAAFVTTKDDVVLDFVRGVITQYDYPSSDPIISACIVFDALGALGVTYTKDPSNSYQETTDDTELIDYLQYPRETLKRKSGDCDDLVILYAAALESIGIRTRFVEIPGHIFMMFEVGKTDQLGGDTMNDMLAIEDRSVWIPVELTSVGKPFTAAWEFGSRNFATWKEKGQLTTLDLHDAWLKYKPASLPQTEYRPKTISRKTIEQTFDNEFKDIREVSIKIRGRVLFARLKEAPEVARSARVQLGIEYARYGLLDEASSFFKETLAKAPKEAAALNNMGNIAFLKEDYAGAVNFYKTAIAASPDDALVRINLVRAYLKKGDDVAAKKTFQEACAIDPEISNTYRAMALKLLGPS